MAEVRQAGAVVVDLDDQRPRVLLVTARDNPDNWLFPKGNVEADESPEDAAVREAREEAGVVGRAVSLLGSIGVDTDDDPARLRYFLLLLERDDEPGEKDRQKEWYSFEEAALKLDSPESVAILNAAEEWLLNNSESK